MCKNGILAAGVCGALLFLGFNVPAIAQQNTGAADMHFARDAAEGGMLEVQLGQMAVQKATNDKVKQFGQRMIDDHSKMNDQLKQVAAKDNITLPTQLEGKDKARYDRLSNMSGTAFERAYMRDQVRDHEQDIAKFQKEASDGQNPDLKNLASTAMPTLQDHLKMAKDAEGSLGITSRR